MSQKYGVSEHALNIEVPNLQWAGVLTPQIEYVQRYASKDAAEEAGAESEDDDDMSSVGSFGDDDDDEPAGPMDDV